ncbi:winged helix-turn-helix domain-containing protein [Deinococcus sp. Marseille-Q6407]|uniref:winged helix-turn-helix domain-containing protein n=1 Tax=Deinococcus sp. Marseille-Q6407 TaxID=2969223 RepID=UPI0021C0AFE0|nr:winged helix-turn-helix domain-containing protein [Deinococcus sp. Marseille-Q6407]
MTAAVNATLGLAHQRTGRHFPNVGAAAAAGAVTDADWCQLLDQARADADVDGDRLYAQRTGVVLAAVIACPGTTARDVARRIGLSDTVVLPIVRALLSKGLLHSEDDERGYRRIYPKEQK